MANVPTNLAYSEVITAVSTGVQILASAANTPFSQLISNTKLIVDSDKALSFQIASTEPTGFVSRTSSSFTFTSSTCVFNIAATCGSFTVYSGGVKMEIVSASITVASSVGQHYIYFNSSGVIQQSLTEWLFSSLDIPIAIIYWNGVKAMTLDERHGIRMDGSTHEYLHDTRGCVFGEGLTMTGSAQYMTTTSGSVWDEDIEFTMSTQTRYKIFYMNGSATWQWTELQSAVYMNSGSTLQYNSGTTMVSAGNNSYIAYWVFGTNSTTSPILIIMGQRNDGTLALATTNATPNALVLGTLPVNEIKLLYRLIFRYQTAGLTTTLMDTTDYRTASPTGISGYIATNHSTLSGLTNLDHPASAVVVTPEGTITATDVGSAINQQNINVMVMSIL